MATASELYHAGKLSEAVAAAIEAVRSAPTDRGKRWLLAELLSFSGDVERADKHYDFLATQSEQPDLAALLGRQLIRAETARREVFTQGRVPEFLTPPPDHVKLTLEALIALRDNQPETAIERIASAETVRPAVNGECNGEPITAFRDLDDLTAGVFEVFTSNGNYYWVSFGEIESIEFRPPARPKDLLWRSARMSVRNGPDGEVYLPTLYANTHTAAELLKLGRGTEYTDTRPVRGTGLREFLVGDDTTRTILELETLSFAG